jgi:hypothetical protein
MHPATPPDSETAQQRFDRLYIASSEICRELGVTRTTVLAARRRGLLPEPIAVNGCTLYIWERHVARPFIDAWKVILNTRRNHYAAQQAAAVPA